MMAAQRVVAEIRAPVPLFANLTVAKSRKIVGGECTSLTVDLKPKTGYRARVVPVHRRNAAVWSVNSSAPRAAAEMYSRPCTRQPTARRTITLPIHGDGARPCLSLELHNRMSVYFTPQSISISNVRVRREREREFSVIDMFFVTSLSQSRLFVNRELLELQIYCMGCLVRVYPEWSRTHRERRT